MTDKNKVFSMIGLATRARKVVSGEFSTEKSVKSGRSHMVIVSEEASDNTKKMFTNMCTHYKVPIYLFGTKEELGHAMGQEISCFPFSRGRRICQDPGITDECKWR